MGWQRLPIVVEVSDKRIAASIHGMPHGRVDCQQRISRSYLYALLPEHYSRVTAYQNRTPVMDPRHQEAVRDAVGW